METGVVAIWQILGEMFSPCQLGVALGGMDSSPILSPSPFLSSGLDAYLFAQAGRLNA